jgi:hypothetical protein
MDKRQKSMLVILVVLLLGMGGVYWFVIRDPGSASRDNSDKPAATVRVRQLDKSKPKVVKKRDSRRRGTREERPTAQVRQRDVSERTTAEKKKRRRGGKKKEKQKKITPAA